MCQDNQLLEITTCGPPLLELVTVWFEYWKYCTLVGPLSGLFSEGNYWYLLLSSYFCVALKVLEVMAFK